MILSAVDIGSNASRLLIVEVTKGKDTYRIKKKLNFLRIPTQLGVDVFKNQTISNSKISYLLKTLRIFKEISNLYKAEQIGIVATSALREADNKKAILDKIQSKLKLNVQVIDGKKEAELVAQSYRMLHNNMQKQDTYILVDVGGGSTDMAILQNEEVVESMSFSIGAIKIYRSAYCKDEWVRFENYLQYLKGSYNNIHLIASGGNARKMLKLFGIHSQRILLTEHLKEANQILSQLSPKEISDRYNVKEDRASVIGGASKIFKTATEILDAEQLIIPKIGLADGVIYDMIQKVKN